MPILLTGHGFSFKTQNFFRENESCGEFYFPRNQNSNKSTKFIVHKIYTCICAVEYHIYKHLTLGLNEALNENIHYYYDKPMCLVFWLFLYLLFTCRVEAGIMRQVVLWDTACNFNVFISNQSIFNCLITGESTLLSVDSILNTGSFILKHPLDCLDRTPLFDIL